MIRADPGRVADLRPGQASAAADQYCFGELGLGVGQVAGQFVDRQFRDGLLDEVRALRQLPQPISREAAQALGYKELYAHLDGRCTLPEAVEQIQTRSRNFAFSWESSALGTNHSVAPGRSRRGFRVACVGWHHVAWKIYECARGGK